MQIGLEGGSSGGDQGWEGSGQVFQVQGDVAGGRLGE